MREDSVGLMLLYIPRVMLEHNKYFKRTLLSNFGGKLRTLLSVTNWPISFVIDVNIIRQRDPLFANGDSV